MPLRVIFIAGPFRAETHYRNRLHIRSAEAWALRVWQAGGVAICPHMNTANFQDEAPDRVWLDGDLAILRRCDGILMCPGWEKSEGSRAERTEAQAMGLDVYYHDDWQTFVDDG